MLLTRAENDKAIETTEYAISLNDKYYEGYCRLAQFYMYLRDEEASVEPLRACIDLGGATSINSVQFLSSAITNLVDGRDFDRALKFALRLTNMYPKDADVLLNTAKIYFIMGEGDLAEEYISRATEIDPKVLEEWEMFLDFLLSIEGQELQS